AQNNLPATLEDLSKFVLIGRDKLQAVRAEISAMKNLNLAKEVREQKLAEGQEIGKLVLLAEAKLGELFNQMPKATTNNPHGNNQFRSNSLREEIDLRESESDDEEEPPSKPKLEVAKDMGFNKNQVADFQKLADNPDAVQKAIDDADEREEIVTRSKALEIIKSSDIEKKLPHVFFNSGNNEWYTPAYIIEAAREAMGTIDLDPASSDIANETVKATTYFTIDDDGLSKEWRGNIWLNPPYASGLIEKFIDKLLTSDYTAAVVLVNNATDTEWFSKLADFADAVVFPKGRVKFLRPEGNTGAPLQGQAILYFGNDVTSFKKNFSQFGRCWQ
ncbi:MAG: hypothetical protein IKN27_08585, partial [Selenomonadaceae bacterium]|nr:hypothetical protein [Selenomonadaceae bacterium]